MIKSVCKLDSRIKSVDDIQTCLKYDDVFINEEGYFAHTLSDFSNLEDCDFGKLVSVDVDNDRYIFNRDNLNRFELFIPKYFLLKPKKKYRPLTDEEFLALFDSCKLHSIRQADGKGRFVITDIYFSDSSGTEEVYVCFDCCDVGYDMDYLLENNFEYLDDHEWKPFGIEIHK